VRAEGAFPLSEPAASTPAARARKIRAGASLVQLLLEPGVRGLGLVGEIKAELVQALARGAGIPDLVGVDAAAVTAQKWPR